MSDAMPTERLQQIKERYDDEMIRREHVAEVIEHVLSRHGEHGTYLDAARALDAAGLLAFPAHDAAVAAEALREVATEVRQLPPETSPRGIAAAIAVKADRIERGVTDA